MASVLTRYLVLAAMVVAAALASVFIYADSFALQLAPQVCGGMAAATIIIWAFINEEILLYIAGFFGATAMFAALVSASVLPGAGLMVCIFLAGLYKFLHEFCYD